MHLTREIDYALRILRALAQNKDAPNGVSAAALSELIGVPIRFTQKILRKLSNGELVYAYKGAGGGYCLTRPPEDITLLEVVEILDGELLLSPCLAQDYECSHAGRETDCCFFHRVFCEMNRQLRQMMRRVTVQTAAQNPDCDIRALLNTGDLLPAKPHETGSQPENSIITEDE